MTYLGPKHLAQIEYADVQWHSGDAPTNVYGNGTDFRKIVLERIGIMEDVNNHWYNWRKVVYGGDSNNTCSCSDIFTIRFRTSLYLAQHAMKNFVENVTGHIASQLTWKQSLINAIHHMNDAHGN